MDTHRDPYHGGGMMMVTDIVSQTQIQQYLSQGYWDQKTPLDYLYGHADQSPEREALAVHCSVSCWRLRDSSLTQPDVLIFSNVAGLVPIGTGWISTASIHFKCWNSLSGND